MTITFNNTTFNLVECTEKITITGEELFSFSLKGDYVIAEIRDLILSQEQYIYVLTDIAGKTRTIEGYNQILSIEHVYEPDLSESLIYIRLKKQQIEE